MGAAPFTTCRREAAHALCSEALGVRVLAVSVGADGTGSTRADIEGAGVATLAAIASAGLEAARIAGERGEPVDHADELDCAAADLEQLRALLPGADDLAHEAAAWPSTPRGGSCGRAGRRSCGWPTPSRSGGA